MTEVRSDVIHAAGFARPDLTAFRRLDELGLEVTGQRLEPESLLDAWSGRPLSEPARSSERINGA